MEAPGSSLVLMTIRVLQPEMLAMPGEAAIGAVVTFLAEDLIGFRHLFVAGELEGSTDRSEIDGHPAVHGLACEWGFERSIKVLRAWTDGDSQIA